MGKKKWVMGIDEVMDALEAEGVSLSRESCTGVYIGRKVRVCASGDVDIGDGSFDRWANSVAATFTPKASRFSRQFHNAFREATR